MLVISWPQLPDRRHLWNGKPGNYVSHCIGHEGKKSLKSELIKQGLCSSCDCNSGARLHDSVGSMTISMSLTDKGVDHWEDVVRMTFGYINYIREEGVKKYIVKELKMMMKLGFAFRGKRPPLKTSEDIAQTLQYWRGEENDDCRIEEIVYK